MVLFIYNKRYKGLNYINIMEESKDKTFIYPHSILIKEYLKIAQQEEKLLDFYYRSLQIFDGIASHSEQNLGIFVNENNKSLSGRYAYIILQTKNALDSFFIHYFALKNGLCNATVLNLRYCFETLLKGYFYITLPLGEKDLRRYHELKQWKIRKKLYTGLLKKKINKLYKMLSVKSHTTIVSSFSAYECSPDTYKDSLETGLYLLHGYFVFFLECFNQFISEKFRKKIKSFFIEFAKVFDNISPTFIPNKEDITSFLKFQDIKMVNPTDVGKLKRDRAKYLNNSVSR